MNFLGIDIGTSSVKVLATDETGTIVGSSTKSYPIDYPKANWAEQNPLDWWEMTVEAVRELLAQGVITEDSVKGIGLSGQMHGLVCLGEDDEVLRPAILWCDQRTQEECDEITEVAGQDNLTEWTGNMALPGFTAPKILWVKKNEPKIFENIEHILLPKDYIRLLLTGDYATEVSDASGMLLLDVANRCWSEDMLKLLGIEEAQLPKVYESYEVTGYLSRDAQSALGLTGEIAVVGGGGDQAAGAIGTGTVEDGVLSVALGTSGVVFASHKEYAVDQANRLHAFCHANGEWHSMGVMLSAASSLKWWIDQVHPAIDNPYDVLLKEAAETAPGSKGLLFLPYLMGERTPYSNPEAKGAFIGLTMSHSRKEMTRAVLEGVVYGLRDSLEIIKDLNIPIKEVRVSGGGAKSDLWKQMLADIFDVKVVSLNSSEGPALGAVILAMVGCGLYKNVNEACERIIKVTSSIEPNPALRDVYDRSYGVYHKLYSDLSQRFTDIHQLTAD